MKRFWAWVEIGWQVARAFSSDRCTFLAAGLCYFVFFALFPLLLVVVAVGGYFLTAGQAINQADVLIGQVFPQQQALLDSSLAAVVAHRAEASLFGLLTLIWAAKNVFLSLGQALNVIWRVPQDRGFVRENLLAIVLSLSVGAVIFLVGVGFAVLSAVISFRLPILGLTPRDIPGIVFLLANVLPVTMAAGLLFGLFLVLPNCKIPYRPAFAGALCAAGAWEVVRRLFGYYVDHVARFDLVYGSLSGIVVFLLWIFVSANLFLLGAEVSKVLHERRLRDAGALSRIPSLHRQDGRRA